MKVFSSSVHRSPTVTRSFDIYLCKREKDVKLEFPRKRGTGLCVGERVTSCLERVDKWQVQATYYLCERRCVKNLVTASLYHQDRLDFSTIDRGHFVPPLADSVRPMKAIMHSFKVASTMLGLQHNPSSLRKRRVEERDVLKYVQGHYNICVTT
jgi:hypothetical protein